MTTPDIPEKALQAAVKALGAHPWNSYPRAAHREHTFDSACMVCRADLEPITRVVLEAAAPILAERAHASSHVASKSPVEVIALSGCSRPEDGRPCTICVGRAEKHVRAVESAGLVVVSADLCEALNLVHAVIACHSRDWGQDASDATLWAVLCGWECEEDHAHDDICGGSEALHLMADRFGWDEARVERIRRLRRAVAVLPEETTDA